MGGSYKVPVVISSIGPQIRGPTFSILPGVWGEEGFGLGEQGLLELTVEP